MAKKEHIEEFIDWQTASLISGIDRETLANYARIGRVKAKKDTSTYPNRWLYKVRTLPRRKRRKHIEIVSQIIGMKKAFEALRDVYDFPETYDPQKLALQTAEKMELLPIEDLDDLIKFEII